MTISVVTPALNAQNTIGATLDSIAAQTYAPLECIVVDGESSDRTVERAKEFSGRVPVKILIGRDTGVYDAMNKGIRAATGDIVCIINSDDVLADSRVFERVVQAFEQNKEANIVYGDIVYTNPRKPESVVRLWRAGKYSRWKLYFGWAMPHPAVFVRRSLYEKYGVFNTSFTLAGDYEIMLRWFLVHGLVPLYAPGPCTRMAAGGLSGRNMRARLRGWKEIERAWRTNNLVPPRLLTVRRILYKLPQFLKV